MTNISRMQEISGHKSYGGDVLQEDHKKGTESNGRWRLRAVLVEEEDPPAKVYGMLELPSIDCMLYRLYHRLQEETASAHKS